MKRCAVARGSGFVLALRVGVLVALSVALLALPPLARAAGSDAAGAELRRLFPQRASIEAGDAKGAALWRLELTPEVLAACRADLSDLRLLDARDQPVPFVVDPGPPPRANPTGLERRPARVLAARRREVPPSGAAAARFEETFELEPPPAAIGAGEWQLVLEVDAPEFVRQLVLDGVRRGEPSQRVEGSLFRIRGLADQQLASALPALPYERLVVQLGGEELFPLRPRFFFELVGETRSPRRVSPNVEEVPNAESPIGPGSTRPSPAQRGRGEPGTNLGHEVLARALPEARVVRIPLAAETAASAGSEHRFALARPAGVVPSALLLETATPAFERQVEVYDVARGRPPVRIGKAGAFRVPGARPVEGLEIELGPASGQTLEVRFDDGDNPALAQLSFSALVRAPSLVFAPPAGGGLAVSLYFGGARARAPRYDLERLLTERGSSGGERVERVERGSLVRLGPVSDNPEYVRTPPLAFATRAGAPVDARLYSHQRSLDVAPSSEGLVRVVLDAADIGVLRPDLGDMRVVDATGRQWPYLLDREPGSESVPLGLGEPARHDAVSRLPLLLPAPPLGPRALVLDASDPYFDRDYHVSGQTPEGKTIELARGRLHRDASSPRQPIVIELARARVQSLVLGVSDADDSPIRWTSASARVDVPRLYVLAEPGAYRLLLGNALDAEPSYDVARARDLILSVAFQDTPLGPLASNPDYRASARLAAGDAPSRIVLWVVLGVAVIALGGITLRLARQR